MPLKTLLFSIRSSARNAGLLLSLFVLAAWSSFAQAPPTAPADPGHCASIDDDRARLRCYDELAGRKETQAAKREIVPENERIAATRVSQLSDRWELEEASRHPLFNVRAHKQNYVLLGRYSDSPNQTPYTPAGTDPSSVEFLDSVEAKFQLSLKMKIAQGIFKGNGDLWVGYTQQNQWQVYNNEISAPFRETNYEPEAMLSFRTNYSLFGLQGRFITLGLEHQSNGRTEPLSRSWNRIYAQFGFERGNFAMTIRPWYRLSEDEADDDNPDIEDYYGHGDVVMQYRHGGQVFSVMGRGNISEGKGAAQLDWSFPLYSGLRGYVQGFTGYGESMIDYNWDQNTIGVGVLLSDWY
ncbi:MAG: phospholipase A [Thermoanaerobaculia bacterium]